MPPASRNLGWQLHGQVGTMLCRSPTFLLWDLGHQKVQLKPNHPKLIPTTWIHIFDGPFVANIPRIWCGFAKILFFETFLVLLRLAPSYSCQVTHKHVCASTPPNMCASHRVRKPPSCCAIALWHQRSAVQPVPFAHPTAASGLHCSETRDRYTSASQLLDTDQPAAPNLLLDSDSDSEGDNNGFPQSIDRCLLHSSNLPDKPRQSLDLGPGKCVELSPDEVTAIFRRLVGCLFPHRQNCRLLDPTSITLRILIHHHCRHQYLRRQALLESRKPRWEGSPRPNLAILAGPPPEFRVSLQSTVASQQLTRTPLCALLNRRSA